MAEYFEGIRESLFRSQTMWLYWVIWPDNDETTHAW